MYYYKIHFFEEDKAGIQVDCGLVAADSYGEAADKVVEFYGEEGFSSFEELYKCEEVLMADELKDMWEHKF
ncbi:hypothetical protein IKZ77_00010 [Candidatus Saccharibacteria bacterium]|nr:hypothetical protein [Candidatus Saccharibacteria bacterium]